MNKRAIIFLSLLCTNIGSIFSAVRPSDDPLITNPQDDVFGNVVVQADEIIGGNLLVKGNLTVDGLTFVNTCNLVFDCNINMALSTDSAHGNIFKGGSRFLHTFASNNLFLGINAGNFTLSGGNNLGIGNNTLQANAAGVNNIAVGLEALKRNTGGHRNIAIGYRSLEGVTTGSNNIAIGDNSGGGLSTGDNNIYIAANVVSSTESKKIRIGNVNDPNFSNFQAGISGVNIGAPTATVLVGTGANLGQLGTIGSSRRFKENIISVDDATAEKFISLNPVQFTYIDDEMHNIQYGMIAEEVEEVMPELIVYDQDGKPYTIQYHIMYALLLKCIQNLTEEVQALKKACMHS
jgi:hypothetical protein